MLKMIAFPFMLTAFLTYFLATLTISAIKEETIISLNNKNTKKTRKDLVRGVDHSQHRKTRKLSQPPKKLNCLVQFSVKKFYRSLEYKFLKGTSWKRSSTSKKNKTSCSYQLKKIHLMIKFQVICNISQFQSLQKVVLLIF